MRKRVPALVRLSVAASAMLVLAVTLLLATRALATSPQVSLQDDRFIRVRAEYNGESQEFEFQPDAAFGSWEKQADADASVPDVGSADAHAYQLSGTIDSIGYMAFQGWAQGGWAGDPSGTCLVNSHVRFTFRLLGCTEFNLRASVGIGTCPEGFNCAGVSLEGPSGLMYEQNAGDPLQTTHERLPAGDYVLEGHAQGTSGDGDFDAGFYEAVWNCHTCPWGIILEPPKGKKVPPGSDPILVASASVPTGQMTYQWRLNLHPLADDGRITGAQTTMLTIHNVAAPDTGYYDVVFTDMSDPNNVIVEPSQLAHLELDTVSGVETTSGSPRAFSMSPATPNPFARATSFRYEAARPMRVRMAIYNVTGARVRVLIDEIASGPRTVTWDGALQSGEQAPTGIYYLRVEAGAICESRKIVLLR